MQSDDPRFFGIGGVTIWNNRDTKDKVYLQIQFPPILKHHKYRKQNDINDY